MKRIVPNLFLLVGCWMLVSGLFAGCKESSKEPVREAAIHISAASIDESEAGNIADAEGGLYYIDFKARKTWEILTNCEWISPSMSKGNPGDIHIDIRIASNKSGAPRSGELLIVSDNNLKRFRFHQKNITKEVVE